MRKFDAKTLARVLQSMVKDSSNPSTAVDSFLAFLQQHHLVSLLPAIARRYEALEAQTSQALNGTLLVAEDLQPQDIENIKEKIGIPKTVTLTTVVDPSLLGGYIILWNNHRYDYSLKHQIERLHEVLVTQS